MLAQCTKDGRSPARGRSDRIHTYRFTLRGATFLFRIQNVIEYIFIVHQGGTLYSAHQRNNNIKWSQANGKHMDKVTFHIESSSHQCLWLKSHQSHCRVLKALGMKDFFNSLLVARGTLQHLPKLKGSNWQKIRWALPARTLLAFSLVLSVIS